MRPRFIAAAGGAQPPRIRARGAVDADLAPPPRPRRRPPPPLDAPTAAIGGGGGRTSSSSSPPLPTTLAAAVLLRRARRRRHPTATMQSVLLRVWANPHVTRACMIVSLYALLAFAWDTDLRFRYRSADVNFGLGEYWHGGLDARAEKRIGRESRGGKLFNDDGDDGGIVARLIVDAAAGDADGDDGGGTDAAAPLFSSSSSGGARGGVPPYLSHARSSHRRRASSSSPPHRGARRRRTATAANPRPSTPWSLSDAIRAVAWMGFALPVVEAGAREARRRRADFRSRRTIASRRSPPRPYRTAATNAHDL